MRKKAYTVFMCIILSIFIFAVNSLQAFAVDFESEELDTVNAALKSVAEAILKTVPSPEPGSVGGEWTVLALARSGENIQKEYFKEYYTNLEEYIKACNGAITNNKYTEYSRIIIALTAIGKNPQSISGYNLLMPLADYENIVKQGINGAIWALIAIDCGNYTLPNNPSARVQGSRERYIEYILNNQKSDGGWALSGALSDPDITAMALQALSKHMENIRVKKAVERAVLCMSERQDSDGGFSSWNTENSESCAQMIVALCELGISLKDERFIKNGKTLLDCLMTYYVKDKGFKHTVEDYSINQMATEQCLYALVSIKRANEGKNSLYDMKDAINLEAENLYTGSASKNPDVKLLPIVDTSISFEDVMGHKHQKSIEALASRKIINGKAPNIFEPNSTMTRAEFAAIITRGLGLPIKSLVVFDDVKKEEWYYDYVNTAYSYGIIKGISEKQFNPNGTIRREEAAVMLARAGSLCGIDMNMNTADVSKSLAGFSDYHKAHDWSIESLAFCYSRGIISEEVSEIKPDEAVQRAEIADMLYNMLNLAFLLQ